MLCTMKKLTFYVVGAVIEDQRENIVDRSICIQSVGVFVVTHESILSIKDQNRAVDEFHQE